jgi:hypothetical protein
METGETAERRRQREILAVMARINPDGGAAGACLAKMNSFR